MSIFRNHTEAVPRSTRYLLIVTALIALSVATCFSIVRYEGQSTLRTVAVAICLNGAIALFFHTIANLLRLRFSLRWAVVSVVPTVLVVACNMIWRMQDEIAPRLATGDVIGVFLVYSVVFFAIELLLALMFGKRYRTTPAHDVSFRCEARKQSEPPDIFTG